MPDVWTPPADRNLGDAVTAAMWNDMVGAGGNLDLLYNRGWRLQGVDATERTTTSTSAVDLCTISGLSIPTSQPLLVVGAFRKSSGAAAAAHVGLKVNATVVVEAQNAGLGSLTTTNQAEDGAFMWLIMPRSTNYLTGIVGIHATRVSATGALGTAAAVLPLSGAWAAVLPNATITSLIIRGITTSGSQTLAVKDVAVYAGGVTL